MGDLLPWTCRLYVLCIFFVDRPRASFCMSLSFEDLDCCRDGRVGGSVRRCFRKALWWNLVGAAEGVGYLWMEGLNSSCG